MASSRRSSPRRPTRARATASPSPPERLLCYALGGGLGPLTRTRAVLAALGWERDVAVLAAPGAEAAAGGLELLVPGFDDAADPPALGAWVARAIAEREPDVLLVDAFPGGVLGELCGLAALDGLALHHTARLLRWGVYARRCAAPLPRYEAVHVVEPLHPAHERVLAGLTTAVAPLALAEPPAAERAPGDAWLVVHTGPAREVRALARIADERRGEAPLRVATPIRVDGLPSGAEVVDAVPAAPLYADAAGIVTAAGFNTVRELAPYRERHVCVPFERRLDDQKARWLRRGASGPAT